MLQNEIEIKEGRIAKLEKSLLQMIDEANSFKQRYKVANEKVNVISKGQIKGKYLIHKAYFYSFI